MAQSNQGEKVKLPSTHSLGTTKLTVVKMTGSSLSLSLSCTHTDTNTHTETGTRFPWFLKSYGLVWKGLFVPVKVYIYMIKLVFSLLFGIRGQGAHREQKRNCIDQQREL